MQFLPILAVTILRPFCPVCTELGLKWFWDILVYVLCKKDFDDICKEYLCVCFFVFTSLPTL